MAKALISRPQGIERSTLKAVTSKELQLITQLSQRKYIENSFRKGCTQEEFASFNQLAGELKLVAKVFADRYNADFGPFTLCSSSGNQITRAGTLNVLWSGVYKGAANKQYAAQISFVVNRQEGCLEVGFYFGRASSHTKSALPEEKGKNEKLLQILGSSVASYIEHEAGMRARFNSLFDMGFFARKSGKRINPEEWLKVIASNPKAAEVVTKIFPDTMGTIEPSTLFTYAAEVLFFMDAIDAVKMKGSRALPPLSPEQRGKQAQRYAEIGNKGELYILQKEIEKLASLGIKKKGYPEYVAQASMSYGYDILSLNAYMEEIFIEVKTTTRLKSDIHSKCFHLSCNELKKYRSSPEKYKLYRVYDIDSNPTYDEVDLSTAIIEADGHIVSY